MGGIFNMDNKFFQGMNKMVDTVGLCVLWILFCIPVFTAGAATTAFYYTMTKVIRRSRGYVFAEFWGSFKSNFKQATLVWLILLAAGILLGIDAYIMRQFHNSGDKFGAIYPVFFVLLMFEVMWSMYLFPYMARFENTLKLILKNAALIALGNILKTLLLFLILVICVLAIYVIPILIVVVPAVYMFLASLILEKIFQKYMSPEDLAAEEERNRDF